MAILFERCLNLAKMWPKVESHLELKLPQATYILHFTLNESYLLWFLFTNIYLLTNLVLYETFVVLQWFVDVLLQENVSTVDAGSCLGLIPECIQSYRVGDQFRTVGSRLHLIHCLQETRLCPGNHLKLSTCFLSVTSVLKILFINTSNLFSWTELVYSFHAFSLLLLIFSVRLAEVCRHVICPGKKWNKCGQD